MEHTVYTAPALELWWRSLEVSMKLKLTSLELGIGIHDFCSGWPLDCIIDRNIILLVEYSTALT